MRRTLALLATIAATPAIAADCTAEFDAALAIAGERAATAYLCRPAMGDIDVVGSRLALEDMITATGRSPDEATVMADDLMRQAEMEAAKQDLSDLGDKLAPVCAKRTRQLQDQFRVAAAKLRLCAKRR